MRRFNYSSRELFQSALPLRGATRHARPRHHRLLISIRAPLAGSDRPSRTRRWTASYFNPRSPCGERPWRGFWWTAAPAYFNPRSPCGERPHRPECGAEVVDISIRAPLAGSDRRYSGSEPSVHSFQSALPLRGATRCRNLQGVRNLISIRAPLAGSDDVDNVLIATIFDFNPRSPCGERRSRRRRTRHRRRNFNPRSPCGERRSMLSTSCAPAHFNPRSPCGERPLYFVASIYYQQSVVFSKTVAANSVDKLRKTTAKSAITRCEAHS